MTSPPDSMICQQVLECLPTGVFAVDREGKINFWNAGAERITGYLKQEVLGRVCSDGFLEHSEGENNTLTGNAAPVLATLREGRGIRVLSCDPRGDCGVHQGIAAQRGGRVRTSPQFPGRCGQNSRNSRTTSKIAAQRPKARRRQNQSRRRRRDFRCRRLLRSSSRKKPRMVGTMGEPGKWRTRILLPP